MSPGRRRFLGNFAGMTATAIAASAITFLALRGPFVTGASAAGMLAFSESMRLRG